MTLKSIDYHRNGVGGLGFHVMIVDDPVYGKMLVVRFNKDADRQTGQVVCAAFSLKELDKRNIAFFTNSFRGDYYSTWADRFIQDLEEEKVETASAIAYRERNKKGRV